MPDYDLGKAHGEVVLDYDNKGIKAAEKDVSELGDKTKKSSKDIADASDIAAKAYEQTQAAAKMLAAEVSKAAAAEEAANAKVQAAQDSANKARAESERIAQQQQGIEQQLSQTMAQTEKAAKTLQQAEANLATTRKQIGDRANDIERAERGLATALAQTKARTEDLAKAEASREQAFINGSGAQIEEADNRIQHARAALTAATGLLGDSEQKVNNARLAAGAATSFLADAEQRVSSARDQVGASSLSAAAAERQVESARAATSQASLHAAAADLKLSAAEDRASTSAQRARSAHDALNVSLNKLKNQDVNIRVNVDNRGGNGLRDLNDQVRNIDRTASSGLSGLNSFVGRTQALIGAAALAAPHLAGLAVSLAQVAQAGAIVPGILAAAGAAIGTLMVGASGIGAAFKESGKAMGGAGSAAKQSAAAQKAAADAIRSAEQGLANAKQNLTIAYEDAARAAEQATRRIADAEKSVIAAQKTAISAQNDLTAARKDAKRMIEDYALAVRGGAIDEREAIQSVADAQKELDDVMRTPAATQKDRDRAQLALDRQVFSLEELRVRNKRLGEDAADAFSKQVEGSDQVVAAQQAIADAAQQIADAQVSVSDAVKAQAVSQVDSQRAIAAAIQGVENAELALQRAHEQSAEAGVSGAGGVASAMSKLSPKAQEFVKAVLAQAEAWKVVKFAVQDALFDNAAKAVTQLANVYLPILKKGMVAVAVEINGVAMQFKDFLLSAQSTKDVATIFENTGKTVKALGPGLVAVAQLLRDIATVGTELLPGLAGGFTRAAQAAADFVKQARESGKLKEFMQAGLDAAKVLYDVLVNIGSIIVSVFTAFDQSGGGTLQILRDLTGQLDDFLKSAEGQSFLQELGKTLAVIGEVLGGLFFQALKAIIPMFTDLAPLIQEVAKNLGEVFGGVLKVVEPLLRAFVHAITDNPDVFVNLATGLGIAAAAMWILNIAMDANPIGAVIIAIVALIAVVQLIIDNWGPISDFFKNLWTDIEIWFKAWWQAISVWFNDTLDGIVNFFKLKWQDISNFFSSTLDGISNFFTLKWQAISDWFEATLTNIGHFFRDGWNNIWKWFTDTLTGMRDTANQKIGEIGRFFADLPGNVLNWLRGIGSWLIGAGRDLVQGLLDGIGNAGRWVFDKLVGIVKGAWNGVLDFLGIHSPSREAIWAMEMLGKGLVQGLLAQRNAVADAAASLADSAAVAVNGSVSMGIGTDAASVLSGRVAATAAVAGIPATAASTGGGVATLERPAMTVIIENLQVAGNFDPSDPVKWRAATKLLEQSLIQLGRDNQ